MKILAIDTSCDETAAAVTEGVSVLSNVIWSQAAAHAKFGGVMPSLAQRLHEERIDWVIEKALKYAFPKRDTKYSIPDTGIDKTQKPLISNIDAIAVTVGPGLSIALGVGVKKAKELASKYKKPLIPVNHIEAHLLSPLAKKRSANFEFDTKNYESLFPAFGLVVSGGNTIFIRINNIADYEMLAQTHDDALGEALDKAARMLGLGYPGGPILEKFSKLGNSNKYTLPIPLIGQEKRQIFSYSGLKTSFYRLLHKTAIKNKQDIYDLAATFQNVAFKHIERVISFIILNSDINSQNLLLGGGVAANTELKRRLRELGKRYNFKLLVPYSKRLTGDNAAMIGVCAYLKVLGKSPELADYLDYSKIDRDPRLQIT